MNEPNKSYIDYLNSLNSYNAKNKNAYSEKNIGNDFFKKTSIEIGVSKFIAKKLSDEVPHVIILTGQAGDGKTSILYQVLNQLNPNYEISPSLNSFTIDYGKNQKCHFIKDFSEIQNNERSSKLDEILNLPQNNTSALIVANTGPLINTFGMLFDEIRQEDAKIQLIDAIKNSDGSEKNICNYKISIINMASIDNSSFATKFIEKIIQDELWENCSNCEKKTFCPILRNKLLLSQNLESAQNFIENHYIWLSEHGVRLTVRSITEQLSFMVTGGCNCNSIRDVYNFDLLYPNLFFGLKGFKNDSKAIKMIAIKETNKNAYYTKKMRIDEELIIKSNYDKLFTKDISEIIKKIENKTTADNRNLFYQFLRRIYLFQNNSSTEQKEKDLEDIFSRIFPIYVEHRKTNTMLPRNIKSMILSALSVIYTGTNINSEKVPITLNRKSGILQPVQFISKELSSDDFKIIKKKSNDGIINQTTDIFYFYPKIRNQELNVRLNLPLLNYFDNLQRGILETDIDPILSHGLETLKVQISEALDSINESDSFKLLLLKNNGTKVVRLYIEDNQLSCN